MSSDVFVTENGCSTSTGSRHATSTGSRHVSAILSLRQRFPSCFAICISLVVRISCSSQLDLD